MESAKKKEKWICVAGYGFGLLLLLWVDHVSCWRGDAKKVAEMMRRDPGFKVSMDLGNGWTLLHEACDGERRSAVIPLLLAHPDINVNAKDMFGWTPFSCACDCGHTSCVREMLKDSRVKVNEPKIDGTTPLWFAAARGHLDVIKWWIASGREMDLGEPGEVDKTDAIGGAMERQDRSGEPAGEIQGKSGEDQTRCESGTWLV